MDDRQQSPEVKEALKRLRQERQKRISELAGLVRRQKKELGMIREHLAAEEMGMTPPRLAESTGLAVSLVMWYLATMKRYGEVKEGGKDGGWFRYLLTAQQ